MYPANAPDMLRMRNPQSRPSSRATWTSRVRSSTIASDSRYPRFNVIHGSDAAIIRAQSRLSFPRRSGRITRSCALSQITQGSIANTIKEHDLSEVEGLRMTGGERRRRGATLTCARSIRHRALRHGERGRDAVGKAQVEEHPFGGLAGHFPGLEIDDEERLPAHELARIRPLPLHPGENRPPVVSEAHGQAQELARARNILNGLDRAHADIERVQRREWDRGFYWRRRHAVSSAVQSLRERGIHVNPRRIQDRDSADRRIAE